MCGRTIKSLLIKTGKFIFSDVLATDHQDVQSGIYQRLLANSFFYLSFENSDHCEDYITEKFYYALNSTAVPIVYG